MCLRVLKAIASLFTVHSLCRWAYRFLWHAYVARIASLLVFFYWRDQNVEESR